MRGSLFLRSCRAGRFGRGALLLLLIIYYRASHRARPKFQVFAAVVPVVQCVASGCRCLLPQAFLRAAAAALSTCQTEYILFDWPIITQRLVLHWLRMVHGAWWEPESIVEVHGDCRHQLDSSDDDVAGSNWWFGDWP